MEAELFKWKDWDVLDDGVWQFLNVELVTHIDEFVPGTKFDYAVISVAENFLVLANNSKKYRYKLHFKVGDPIIEDSNVGFNDCRCQKCNSTIGWLGELSEPPPCSSCGHVSDYSETEQKIKEVREKLLADFEKETK